MKVINIWGAPGAGKSTIAAGLFHLMKISGYNVEYVQEYAKSMYYGRGRQETQFKIAACQNEKMEELRGEIDWVITDSPLLLSLVYCGDDYHKSFASFLVDVNNSYDNIHFLVQRNKDVPYNPNGRYQKNADDSDCVVPMMLEVMRKHDISCMAVQAHDAAAEEIYKHIAKIGTK